MKEGREAHGTTPIDLFAAHDRLVDKVPGYFEGVGVDAAEKEMHILTSKFSNFKLKNNSRHS